MRLFPYRAGALLYADRSKSMTESHDPWAHYVYEPLGSLWANEPAFVSGISPEEWNKAAETLTALGELHTRGVLAGGEALDVALLEASERVRMQQRRAVEEGWEDLKGGEPSPGQHDRITRLIERCDHLSNAVDAAREAAKTERDRVYAEDYILGELVPFLEAERDDARDELRRYKREIGLLGEE
ncbi:MAG: hypothetical protein CYG60_19060 [Actinobacteria bacterium]|nr:MAG: hypothetical protein CYG60_19060 [Actinomycetota bacterium]